MPVVKISQLPAYTDFDSLDLIPITDISVGNTKNYTIAQVTQAKVDTSLLGANSGVATLDSSGKLTTSQIPSALVGALQYQGIWNASTNTPTLVSSIGIKGFYYKVNVAGTTTIDTHNNWTVGDLVIFDGTVWEQVQGGTSDVVSVAGRTGAVTLTSGDVGLGNVNNTSDASKPISTAQATAIGLKQDTLVSGTNIKTINTVSLVGSGNIDTTTGTTFTLANSKVTDSTTTLATVAQTAIALGSTATYRTVKLTIQATQGTNYHSTEITIIHDGTNIVKTEYGTVYTASALATYSANIVGSTINLLITGASASSTVYIIRSTYINL
jgi:hypothetical protein